MAKGETLAYEGIVEAYDPEIEDSTYLEFIVFAKSLSEVEEKLTKEFEDFFIKVIECECKEDCVTLP